MSEEKSVELCANRASAIAALNAVVVHRKLGNFMSLYMPIHRGQWVRNREGMKTVPISGRTDTGTWLHSVIVVIRKQGVVGVFPYEKAVVFIYDIPRLDQHTYCQCHFGDEGIRIEDLNDWPAELQFPPPKRK